MTRIIELLRPFLLPLRLLGRLRRMVYNRLYRPSGIVSLPESSTEPEQRDYRVTVRPGKAREYAVYVVQNGRLRTDGLKNIAVVNARNQLVSGASWEWGGMEQGALEDEENSAFSANFSARPKTFKGTVSSLWTGGGGNGNYFHWLFDSLPRLHLLKLSGLFEESDLFAVPALKFPFQRQSLSLLGLSDDQTIESRAVNDLKADRVVATDHPRGNTSRVPRWICGSLRKAFLPALVPPPFVAPRIYLSRRDSLGSRRIRNEEVLVKRLSAEGFVVVTATDYSFAEQISLFHQADGVVAPHGAGLGNLVFCRPGTKVVEIFSSAWWLPMYEAICNHLYLAYAGFEGSVEPPLSGDSREALKLDISVDIDRLLSTIETLNNSLPPQLWGAPDQKEAE